MYCHICVLDSFIGICVVVYVMPAGTGWTTCSRYPSSQWSDRISTCQLFLPSRVSFAVWWILDLISEAGKLQMMWNFLLLQSIIVSHPHFLMSPCNWSSTFLEIKLVLGFLWPVCMRYQSRRNRHATFGPRLESQGIYLVPGSDWLVQ